MSKVLFREGLGSVLELGDFCEESGRGSAWEEGDDGDLSAGRFDGEAFIRIERVEGVVAALDIDIGGSGQEELCGGRFLEDENGRDGFEGSEETGPIGFGVDGS